ncbi:MAG: recombinase family protein [Butyrivibrio sp.]|nr:recombinase family protein [Butyrivibrio sp.]
MIYGYARVSTAGQAREGNSLESQEKQLREQGATKIFTDAYTGTKMERPAFDKLLKVIKEGDTLVVTKLDRFCRSVSQGIKMVDELLEKGIKVNIINMGMLDNTPTGKFVRNIMLSFAEFERDMIIQRTQEGKAIAKKRPDFREGRPKKFTRKQIEHAMELLESNSYKQVSEITGISVSTLARERRKYKKKE